MGIDSSSSNFQEKLKFFSSVSAENKTSSVPQKVGVGSQGGSAKLGDRVKVDQFIKSVGIPSHKGGGLPISFQAKPLTQSLLDSSSADKAIQESQKHLKSGGDVSVNGEEQPIALFLDEGGQGKLLKNAVNEKLDKSPRNPDSNFDGLKTIFQNQVMVKGSLSKTEGRALIKDVDAELKRIKKDKDISSGEKRSLTKDLKSLRRDIKSNLSQKKLEKLAKQDPGSRVQSLLGRASKMGRSSRKSEDFILEIKILKKVIPDICMDAFQGGKDFLDKEIEGTDRKMSDSINDLLSYRDSFDPTSVSNYDIFHEMKGLWDVIDQNIFILGPLKS